MKFEAKVLSIALFMLTPAIVSGVPAHPGARTVVNPDGTEITIRLLGDEYGHVTVDSDGKAVEQDADGYWRRVERRRVPARKPRRMMAGEVNRSSFPRTGQGKVACSACRFP